MNPNGTILIIEDNAMSLEMAKGLLHLAGYETLEAYNADNGIQLAKEHRPNLILMDMHMPAKSGYEATQELKANPTTGDIPIVAFTAMAMREEQERAMAKGCVGVICKPINVKEFAKTVEGFLQARPAPKSVEPSLTMPAFQASPGGGGACPHCADKVKLEQEFDTFLFHVSHDLQGPLRKIQQFAGFLENPEVEKMPEGDRQSYVHGIRRNAQELEALLNGLLQLSRIPVVPLQETVSLSEIAREILAKRQAQIDSLQARVEVPSLPVVRGDREQLARMLEAVLDNALKFKADGRPPIVKITSRNAGDGFNEITVQDDGIGFPNAMAEKIFRPMIRLNGESRFPGHGMGLAIVKKIVEHHGGTVSAHCEPGIMTTISLRLPQVP